MVGKKWIGVEDLVTHKLPRAPVQLIGARLGNKVGNSAGAAAEFRGVVQGQCLNFLHRIQDGRIDRAAAQAGVGHSVDQEAIEIFAHSVDYRIGAIFRK